MIGFWWGGGGMEVFIGEELESAKKRQRGPSGPGQITVGTGIAWRVIHRGIWRGPFGFRPSNN